eukprot:363711-Chlamydomonas_euryale.AAC.7
MRMLSFVDPFVCGYFRLWIFSYVDPLGRRGTPPPLPPSNLDPPSTPSKSALSTWERHHDGAVTAPSRCTDGAQTQAARNARRHRGLPEAGRRGDAVTAPRLT